MEDKSFVKTMTDYMICEKELTINDADERAICPVCKNPGLWHKFVEETEKNQSISTYVLCSACRYAEVEIFYPLRHKGENVTFDYGAGKYVSV